MSESPADSDAVIVVGAGTAGTDEADQQHDFHKRVAAPRCGNQRYRSQRGRYHRDREDRIERQQRAKAAAQYRAQEQQTKHTSPAQADNAEYVSSELREISSHPIRLTGLPFIAGRDQTRAHWASVCAQKVRLFVCTYYSCEL